MYTFLYIIIYIIVSWFHLFIILHSIIQILLHKFNSNWHDFDRDQHFVISFKFIHTIFDSFVGCYSATNGWRQQVK